MAESNTNIIDAKTAANIAAKYYSELGDKSDTLSIEEVELDDDDQFWHITLGITKLSGVRLGRAPDSYKISKISAKDGKVRSMKIRTIH